MLSDTTSHLFWFTLALFLADLLDFCVQIFCLNNIIHFSSGLKMTVNENLWMKQPTIPPWLAGKIVKYRPLSEPIRLQDLEDFRLLASLEKNKICYVVFFFLIINFCKNYYYYYYYYYFVLFHLFIYWILFCRVISIFHVPGSFLNFLEICSVVCSMIFCDIWHKHHRWYFKIVIGNFTSRYACEIWDNFEISCINHAIFGLYYYQQKVGNFHI